ncbi:hypothetical protein HJC23_006227 [Cyclotella cryptica]|uniref:Uncharacterized protein n=1 Tax=Cyclotella cryptica TaxID=29204 RepID=A0ABD3Q217_9STRA|eukprot:CCRYP_010870-RA/>CCRYP_010870-RA protein AED:0.00 eAED:0.00 QI:141/-1/1/1/-1/1/1/181/794
MATRAHHYNRGGVRKHLGDIAIAEPSKTTKFQTNDNDTNNENQCPNIFVPRQKTVPARSGNNVAKIARLFDANATRIDKRTTIKFDANSQKAYNQNDFMRNATESSTIVQERNQTNHRDNGNGNAPEKTNDTIGNNDTEDATRRETRRKIMLQERRMERFLSQKVVDLSCPPPVKRNLRQDFGKEATKESFTDEVTNCKKRKISTKEYGGLPLDNKESSFSLNCCRILSQILVISLVFYQVQLHCHESARFVSFVGDTFQYYFKRTWAWIDTSFMLSGNVLVLRMLLEWRHRTSWAEMVGSASSFDLEDFLHVVFVGVFMVRCLVMSFTWARQFFGKENKDEESRGAKRLKCGLLFVASTAVWMMILPLYNECISDSKRYCIFIQSVAKGGKNVVERVISSPRYSFLDVLAMKFYTSLSLILKTKIKGRLFKELRRAFINPFQFHGRLKKLFTIIRWAKFLAPLIGTCNKLRGHILDMMKKKGQHLTSKTARKMWADVIEALSLQSKTERAVLQLQKRFRERREEKAKRRIELISAERPTAQHIRKRLREERNLSKSKLIKMEILDNQRQLRRQVSKCEKEHIVKHSQTMKLEMRRLLLSPKTSFAVGWKCVAIASVILEVSQMIFAPLLSGELKKMSLDEFISVVLFASCDKKERARDICATSTWKQAWLVIVQVVSRILVPSVYAVCFLDVFVTFSTGELTSSGKLVPKPFVARYIFPGIGLQLIVNPTMVAFSKLVKRAIAHSLHVGPSLCFHFVLVCLPLATYCYDILLGIIFEFIEKQNKILSSHSIFD